MSKTVELKCPRCDSVHDVPIGHIEEFRGKGAEVRCPRCWEKNKIEVSLVDPLDAELPRSKVKMHCGKCGHKTEVPIHELPKAMDAGAVIRCPECWIDRINIAMYAEELGEEALVMPKAMPTILKVSDMDREHIENIVFSDGKKDYNWFSCYLFRLLMKCDSANFARLKLVYPEHAEVIEWYRTTREGDKDGVAPIAPEIPDPDGTVTVVIKDGMIADVRGLPTGWDWAMDDQDLT